MEEAGGILIEKFSLRENVELVVLGHGSRSIAEEGLVEELLAMILENIFRFLFRLIGCLGFLRALWVV